MKPILLFAKHFYVIEEMNFFSAAMQLSSAFLQLDSASLSELNDGVCKLISCLKLILPLN
jgi:hypothetical protein